MAMGNWATSTAVDFKRSREVIREVVMDHIETVPGENRISEFEIRDRCIAMYPEIEELNLITFLEMLHGALLVSGRQYQFYREGKRSFFGGFGLRQSDSYVSHKADKPDQRAPITFDVLDAFLGHIAQADEDTRVRVRDVKEIHRKLEISENYSDVLKALKVLDGVSSEEEISDGKTRKYLTGLTLTKTGKKLLAE